MKKPNSIIILFLSSSLLCPSRSVLLLNPNPNPSSGKRVWEENRFLKEFVVGRHFCEWSWHDLKTKKTEDKSIQNHALEELDKGKVLFHPILYPRSYKLWRGYNSSSNEPIKTIKSVFNNQKSLLLIGLIYSKFIFLSADQKIFKNLWPLSTRKTVQINQ